MVEFAYSVVYPVMVGGTVGDSTTYGVRLAKVPALPYGALPSGSCVEARLYRRLFGRQKKKYTATRTATRTTPPAVAPIMTATCELQPYQMSVCELFAREERAYLLELVLS